MKAINHLNYFFTGVPAILILIGLLGNPPYSGFFIYGFLFSILTGLFQVAIGGSMLADEPRDRNLQLYVYGVILYFITLFIINPFLPDYFFKKHFIFGMPAVLALYISIIIYKKAHK